MEIIKKMCEDAVVVCLTVPSVRGGTTFYHEFDIQRTVHRDIFV